MRFYGDVTIFDKVWRIFAHVKTTFCVTNISQTICNNITGADNSIVKKVGIEAWKQLLQCVVVPLDCMLFKTWWEVRNDMLMEVFLNLCEIVGYNRR